MRDKPTIEVNGTYKEITAAFKSVIDTIETAMSHMTQEDAEKARFKYKNNFGQSFTVEIPREDD